MCCHDNALSIDTPNHEKIWYTITKKYNLCKNIELCKLSCVFYHIHIKLEQTNI